MHLFKDALLILDKFDYVREAIAAQRGIKPPTTHKNERTNHAGTGLL
jgi:hypothetical protein